MAKKTKGKAGVKRGQKVGAPRAKAKKTVKEIVAQITDAERKTLFFKHKNTIRPALADFQAAKKELDGVYAKAKAEGFPKKEFDLSFKLERDDGQDGVRSEVERILRMSSWMNLSIGTQLEMFAKNERNDGTRHYEDGRLAALNDEPARAPDHLSQHDQQLWLSGHTKGRQALNVERARGFKPLGEVAGGLGLGPVAQFDPASGAAIGTEPAAAEVAH